MTGLKTRVELVYCIEMLSQEKRLQFALSLGIVRPRCPCFLCYVIENLVLGLQRKAYGRTLNRDQCFGGAMRKASRRGEERRGEERRGEGAREEDPRLGFGEGGRKELSSSINFQMSVAKNSLPPPPSLTNTHRLARASFDAHLLYSRARVRAIVVSLGCSCTFARAA